MLGSDLHYSKWTRFGVKGLRVRGARGRVRYQLQLVDGSLISAGFFGTVVEAIQGAHAVAVKRSRHASLRSARAASPCPAWRAGNLDSLLSVGTGGTAQ